MGLSAYMRPMENMKLRRKDLVPPSMSITKFWAVIICASETNTVTKTHEQDDAVLLDSSYLGWLGPAYTALTHGEGTSPLWDFSYSQVTIAIRSIAELFNISDLVAYQLRHSGPSVDRAMNLRSIEDVKKRGRWASHQAVRRYEKAGRLSQTELSYSPEFRAYAAICEKQLEGVVLGHISHPSDASLRVVKKR